MSGVESSKQIGNILESFLSVYWLRPETALWRTIDVLAMDSFIFESPSLDLGCGDGVFSFIRAGGRFDFGFDVFQSVTALERYFENVDIYDNYDDSYMAPLIGKMPGYQIDMALDHKEALLKKAATLGLYRKMVCQDANQGLPLDEASFKTVFSNIIYWLDNPHAIIGEIARILTPDGRAILMLPNDTFQDYSFYCLWS